VEHPRAKWTGRPKSFDEGELVECDFRNEPPSATRDECRRRVELYLRKSNEEWRRATFRLLLGSGAGVIIALVGLIYFAGLVVTAIVVGVVVCLLAVFGAVLGDESVMKLPRI